MGDDWPLFVSNYGENEVFEFLINLIKKVNNGDISGIGFHPWILFSNNKILNGFLYFLDFLHKQSEYKIKTAVYFVDQIR